ncbi:unnamed protein product [Ixodes pacificus]
MKALYLVPTQCREVSLANQNRKLKVNQYPRCLAQRYADSIVLFLKTRLLRWKLW